MPLVIPDEALREAGLSESDAFARLRGASQRNRQPMKTMIGAQRPGWGEDGLYGAVEQSGRASAYMVFEISSASAMQKTAEEAPCCTEDASACRGHQSDECTACRCLLVGPAGAARGGEERAEDEGHADAQQRGGDA